MDTDLADLAGASSLPDRTIPPAELLAMLARLDSCAEALDLRDTLLDCLVPYGFCGFSLAIDRKLKTISIHVGFMTTWPASFNERYISQGLFHHDPVMTQSRHMALPFVWDMSIYDVTREDHARLAKIRGDLGVTGGIVIPVIESMGGRTILMLSGNGFSHSPAMLLSLRVLLQHVIARLNLIKSGGSWDEPRQAFVREMPLTARERQVLGWIAFGKSSRDVGQIMGISEHTVNEYIASAVRKLKASNRTEAVALALMTEEIDR